MLNKQGFDLWANEYDRTVQVSEESNLYPFAGYREVLNRIFNEVMQKEGAHILDIGFGTGILAGKLYENGHSIDGVDFSPEMIAIAKEKMPEANLLEWDIADGLPPEMDGKSYDAIISTYALHHLTDEEKWPFIANLVERLSPDGKLFIGDIAFRTREELERCRLDSLEYWDGDEFYFVFDELKAALAGIGQCEFHPVSHCGGVIVISR